ncbi:hypothetical protein Z045_05850 [Rhodococcus pyridinivorans KG-16]|uniref:Uncharacterized protein n=1 Tax=Rhodococcus pyridinivorans KG-16 TaxID=1441730 RepID=A0A0V9UNX7_9NOCA|nr:hypothetical protein Z045_05850 [Rhodococcus pyridinivorans KG-16]
MIALNFASVRSWLFFAGMVWISCGLSRRVNDYMIVEECQEHTFGIVEGLATNAESVLVGRCEL